MSVELLKRAAERLREQSGRLPEVWRDQRWRVVQTDTESLDGLAVCTDNHADDPHGAYDCCWSTEPVGHARVAEFIVLMHPPVALALADLLDAHARHDDARVAAEAEVGLAPGTIRQRIDDLAEQLARAILREPEESTDG